VHGLGVEAVVALGTGIVSAAGDGADVAAVLLDAEPALARGGAEAAVGAEVAAAVGEADAHVRAGAVAVVLAAVAAGEVGRALGVVAVAAADAGGAEVEADALEAGGPARGAVR